MAAIDTKVKYRRQFLPVAKKMMQDGGTLQDLADKFSVCLGTIRKWFEKYPEFKIAVLAGKDEFDIEQMEPELLAAIKPHTETETSTVTEDEKPVKVTNKVKKMLGNPALMLRWLSLRQPERWREIHKLEIEGGEGQEDRLRKAMEAQVAEIKAELIGEKTKLF